MSQRDPRQRRRVLVVDDDSTIVETLYEVLSDEGYEVDGYTDPERALARLRDGARPDVILLDCVMPGLSGEQFVRELRASHIATPIVLFTAARDARHLLDDNIVGYIEKPFDLDELLDQLAGTPPSAAGGPKYTELSRGHARGASR